MKTVSRIILLGLLSVFLLAGTAMALPVNPRPVPGLTNLGALQTFLDSQGQTINVYNDQRGAALWTTGVANNSQFSIMLEAAAWAGTSKLGIYNSDDPTSQFEIFSGGYEPGDSATLHFNVGGFGTLLVDLFDASEFDLLNPAAAHSYSVFTGVAANNFGFYLDATGAGQPQSQLVFSEDDLNTKNMAQNLVYAGTGISAGSWWICFEDQARWISSDSDFTDFVILAESINPSPIPEPTTMLLLGAGLIGLVGVGRTKLFKRG